jgi:hypothetical protein
MALDETPGSITEPQSKYIAGLVDKKDMRGNERWTPTHEQLLYLRAGDYSAMSKDQADKAIKKLLMLNDRIVEEHPLNSFDELAQAKPQSLPAGATSDEDEPPPVPVLETRDPVHHNELVGRLTELEAQVDEGYYFIVNPNLADHHDRNNGERFYHVSKGKEGTRWEGYTFVESRGGDFLYKVRDVKERIAILETIAQDPVTAMNEYGMRLGVCGCCGRTLTARDSRLRGIGPICAARLMMEDAQATPDQLDMLTKLGIRKG